MGCSAELFLNGIWLRLYSVHVQYFEKTWCSCKKACQSSCNVQYTIARAKPIISDSKVLYSALAPIVKGAEIIWFYRVRPPCCPYAGWHILCRTLLRFKPCICLVLSLSQLQMVTKLVYSGQALYRLGQLFA